MKTLIRLTRNLIVQFPFHFSFLIILVFLQGLLSGLSVVMLAPITDFLIESGQGGNSISKTFKNIFKILNISYSFFNLCSFYIGFVILNGFLAIAVRYAILRIKYDVLIFMFVDTMKVFFNARYLFFVEGRMGKMLNTFQKEIEKIGDSFGHAAMIFASFIQVLILLAIPITINFKITLFFIAIVLILTFPVLGLKKTIYKLGKGNTETANKMVEVLHETLTSAKLVISFGQKDHSVERYHDSWKDHSNVSIKFQTLNKGIMAMITPIAFSASIICLMLAFNQEVPMVELVMVLFAFTRLAPPLGEIYGKRNLVEGFLPAYEQLESFVDKAKSMKEPRGNKVFSNLESKISLKQLSFSYPNREIALNNINISFKAGKTSAIVGQSGSGKTTLVDLILGLYQPISGHIEIDENNLNDYNIETFRKRIGYVPQEPQMFNSTIKENLLWSNTTASNDDIWNACKVANISKFIKSLPDGINTELGDRGVKLSGGQRQRLALARAIIRKPELLILDEATSALDSESEKLIEESLIEISKNITLIIIAHRLSTIKNVDRIYVLESGRLVEEGSYKELMLKESGVFQNMVSLQNL